MWENMGRNTELLMIKTVLLSDQRCKTACSGHIFCVGICTENAAYRPSSLAGSIPNILHLTFLFDKDF